jgi:hypothetical protein
MHSALAFAMSGDSDSLRSLIDNPKGPAADVLGPIARGFDAFARQRWSEAVRELHPVLATHECVGGSRAQRDLLEYTVTSALLRNGQVNEARRLIRHAVLRTAAADFRLRDWWAKPDLLGRPLSIAHLRQDQLGIYDLLLPNRSSEEAARCHQASPRRNRLPTVRLTAAGTMFRAVGHYAALASKSRTRGAFQTPPRAVCKPAASVPPQPHCDLTVGMPCSTHIRLTSFARRAVPW